MVSSIDFSIIIPHKDSLDCVSRLLNSIPISDKIEVILVDNSIVPIDKANIITDRTFTLLYSDPKRFAGGARNVGIENAHGKWLIFADADDFFAEGAFDIFKSHLDSSADLVYFKVDSVYDDTLRTSNRHISLNSIIDGYSEGRISEIITRITYLVPWGKMVQSSLVREYNLRFDEVLAANDVMFSTLVGFYANSFYVDERVVYVATTRKGSLANRFDVQVTTSRYNVALRRNKFLKENGLGQMQGSVMVYIYRALKSSHKLFFSFLAEAIRYRQNIFIGWRNWFRTIKVLGENDSINKKYITN